MKCGAMDMEYREAPSQESPTSSEDYTQEQKPALRNRRRCDSISSSWSWWDLIRNIFYSLLWIVCLCSSAYSLWRVQILESELQQLREFLRISPIQVSILHMIFAQIAQYTIHYTPYVCKNEINPPLQSAIQYSKPDRFR